MGLSRFEMEGRALEEKKVKALERIADKLCELLVAVETAADKAETIQTMGLNVNVKFEEKWR